MCISFLLLRSTNLSGFIKFFDILLCRSDSSLRFANGVTLLRPHAFLHQTFFCWKKCVILTDVLWLVNRFSCSAVFVCSFDFCGACAACFVLLLVAAVQLSARKLILNIAFMICFSWISFHDVHLLFSDRQSFFFARVWRFRHSYPCFPFFDCSSFTRAHCHDLKLKLLSRNELLRPSSIHHRALQITYPQVNRNVFPSLLFWHRPTLPSLTHHHFPLHPLWLLSNRLLPPCR